MARDVGGPSSRWYGPVAVSGPAAAIGLGLVVVLVGRSSGYAEHCPSPSCGSGQNCTTLVSCYHPLTGWGWLATGLGAAGAVGGIGLIIAGTVYRGRHPLPPP